ncbi:MAG: BlaI/MecI/CopY family transcriptional regulator [Planctomycetes bacterium]|nr:BlaI/MecI/CopY family transcriptional regulator [Planctomycetota bacterium]
MNLPRLTPAEFEIMNVIWSGEEMTITEVLSQINSAGDRKFSRSTIQVQMQRLSDKGWLKHRNQGKKFLFSATVKRSEASASIAEDIKKRVFGDSCVALFQTLLDHTSISSNDIEAMKQLIDKHAKSK